MTQATQYLRLVTSGTHAATGSRDLGRAAPFGEGGDRCRARPSSDGILGALVALQVEHAEVAAAITPTPAPARLSVPASIDATGASDASAALNAWIATVPDGSTIVFKASGVAGPSSMWESWIATSSCRETRPSSLT